MAPSKPAIALISLLAGVVGCASGQATQAPTPAPAAVPARCLDVARPYAAPAVDRPKSFLEAHEAFVAGQAAEAEGDTEAAQAAFAKAVAADPDHGLARIALAEAHWLTDNDVEAIRGHLASAVLLLPDNPRAHLRLADAQAELGAHAQALVHWQCALDLKPSMVAAHIALARHYLDRGKPVAAERHVRSALEVEPEDYRHHSLLAQALAGQTRFAPAGEAAARAAELVGRSAALFRRAAGLFDKGDRPARAAEMRAQADRIDPPAEKRKLRPLRKRKRRGKAKRRRRSKR